MKELLPDIEINEFYQCECRMIYTLHRCAHVHTHTHARTHSRTYTHTHTHTHTHTQPTEPRWKTLPKNRYQTFTVGDFPHPQCMARDDTLVPHLPCMACTPHPHTLTIPHPRECSHRTFDSIHPGMHHSSDHPILRLLVYCVCVFYLNALVLNRKIEILCTSSHHIT